MFFVGHGDIFKVATQQKKGNSLINYPGFDLPKASEQLSVSGPHQNFNEHSILHLDQFFLIVY